MGWFDVAQICLNGHVINEATKKFPQFNKDFCDKCGAKTITQCPHCSTNIRGKYHVEGVFAPSRFRAPAFCPDCGVPYPWTESKLQAAKELAEELEGLTEEELRILAQSIDDLVKDTPKTELAATRTKKLIAKAGKEAAGTLRDILVDIASATAKKLLFGS